MLATVSAHSMVAQPAGWRRAWQRRGVYPDRPDTLDAASATLGISAPWRAPRWVWAAAWRGGKRVLPFLHRWDECAPADTCVNLNVCWLKAIAGNRRGDARLRDGGLAYDLLPPVTRRVVAWPLCCLFPPLHHQNVALRTAYLDGAVTAALADDDLARAMLVSVGAGFDVRAFRVADGLRCAEIDLPDVVSQKRALLARLARRRPAARARVDALAFATGNLSVRSEAVAALRQVLRGGGGGGGSPTPPRHVVYVVEALLIYLPPESGEALLRACVDEAAAAGASRVSLCFADRLPGVEQTSAADAAATLARARLELDEASWLPKPGLARHMGVARWTR